MAAVKIEAPEGVTLSVERQVKVEKPTVITKQGYDEHGNPSIVTEHGPKVVVWETASHDRFASEVRTFGVDENQRLVITG